MPDETAVRRTMYDGHSCPSLLVVLVMVLVLVVSVLVLVLVVVVVVPLLPVVPSAEECSGRNAQATLVTKGFTQYR